MLEPSNFTPATRTPWGGRRIVERLKPGVVAPGPVGESWELSVEPDFPSRIEGGPLLEDALRDAGLASTSLLVKLIDAADDLSVQIHPGDEDPALEDDQSGKPEAWYILDADPGAGLYLGFAEGVTKENVDRALSEGAPLDRLMHFVPVSEGDMFLIEPGTPHSIGRGVMLVEPQRVTPGKRGVTYRYWDWNRAYDDEGRPDPDGNPRELHSRRALEVTRWEGPRAAALLERIHHRAGPATVDGAAHLETLCGEDGPLESSIFLVQRLQGSGVLELDRLDALSALTVIEGGVRIEDRDGAVEIPRGRTATLLPSSEPCRLTLDRAHALLCSV